MNEDLIWAVVRLLLALPLVLGLAYLVLKYGLAKRYATMPGNRRIKLVEQLPLGPKTVLSLVALGGRYYLLAHQDNSVSLIKELDELPEPEDSKIGDIVELTPKTVEELDRIQKSEGLSGIGSSPGNPEGGFSMLKRLAGKAAVAGQNMAARLAAGVGKGKKGEK